MMSLLYIKIELTLKILAKISNKTLLYNYTFITPIKSSFKVSETPENDFLLYFAFS